MVNLPSPANLGAFSQVRQPDSTWEPGREAGRQGRHPGGPGLPCPCLGHLPAPTFSSFPWAQEEGPARKMQDGLLQTALRAAVYWYRQLHCVRPFPPQLEKWETCLIFCTQTGEGSPLWFQAEIPNAAHTQISSLTSGCIHVAPGHLGSLVWGCLHLVLHRDALCLPHDISWCVCISLSG